MKKSIVLFIHLFFWFSYLLVLKATMVLMTTVIPNAPTDTFRVNLSVIGLLIVPAIVSFYLYYFPVFDRFLKKKRYLLLTVSAVLAILVSAGLGSISMIMLLGSKSLFYSGAESFIGINLSMLVVGFSFGTTGLIIRGFIEWFNEQKLKKELQEKNHAMELQLVKAQLDPHFLFNTLHNIDALIAKDQEKASEYLTQLSEILRFMLYETKTESIPLREELAYIEKYIGLQKIRTDNQDFVNYAVTGSSENLEIAPLLFIPFIENAFKFSNNKKVKDAISIMIEINNNKVLFSSSNKFDGVSSKGVEGLGIELIRKRLALLYPSNHSLKLQSNTNMYHVRLEIEL